MPTVAPASASSMLTLAAPADPDEGGNGLPAVDVQRRYVKVLERRADGLVAFEFAIGWPELAVDLLLPAAAFEEFCAVNRVVMLPP